MSKIVKIVKFVKKCQIFQKFSNLSKIVKMLFRSCFLITLIKCIKDHKSLGSLFVCQNQKVSNQVTKWVTRSPIELFWTVKKKKLSSIAVCYTVSLHCLNIVVQCTRVFLGRIKWDNLLVLLGSMIFQSSSVPKMGRMKTACYVVLKALNPICHHHVFAHTSVCVRIQVLFFFTFPHFEYGRGYNTFDPPKNYRFPRNYKSWSNLPNFHKGGPLRTSQSPWKSHFFRPFVGVVLGIQKL